MYGSRGIYNKMSTLRSDYIGKTWKEILLENSIPEPNTGCRIWMGTCTGGSGQEYGCININGSTVFAHRRSYEEFIGPIPAGYEPHHKCKMKPCIEPAHLILLTRSAHMKEHRSRSLEGNCIHGHSLKEHGYVGHWKSGDIILCRQCRRGRENRDYKLGLREMHKQRRITT
jgi:HNH endonuclease